MNALIIYDSTGYIITQTSGSVREPIGIPFIWVEIPSNKRLVSIDTSVTPNVPIYEDIPKTAEEILQERVSSAENAILDLMTMSMM